MSLSQALSTALSGLRTTQAGLSLVSSNVANAETTGYIRKTLNQVQTNAGQYASGVRIEGVNRELDQYMQKQLWTETSGLGFAGMRAQYLGRLQSVYGTPGSQATLENVYAQLTSTVQALTTSPDSPSARINVVNAAQSLAAQLNQTTRAIQQLRSDCEQSLAGSINAVNTALQQIAKINNQLQSGGNDATKAAMLDQRDNYVTQLAQLMDVRTTINEAGQMLVFSAGGAQLAGAEAATLTFDAQGTLTPTTVWDADPMVRGVGTITLSYPRGGSLDLVAMGSFRSGQIAAFLDLRDNVLVQAQNQIDQLAAVMASALSNTTTAGTATPAGPPQQGFDVDLAGMVAGNSIELTYTDNNGPIQRTVTIVRVDDPSVLPLTSDTTINPNDQVIGIDFSGGMASVVNQLNTALGSSNIQFSNPSGQVLRVVDDGGPNLTDIDALSVTKTATTLTGNGAVVPLFTDGGFPYSGAISVTGAQVTGFAGRINVNAGLLGDPSRLVVFNTSPQTPAGDTTRPDFIYQQLTSASFYFSSESGIGTASQPYRGTLLGFTQQLLSQQGEQASAADQLAQGQEVVVNTLEERFHATSGVNIDEEMAHLLSLQNAYAANARVMSTVREMFDALLRI
jgi:flagellar hook-associated protein 1 FlgK